MVVSQLGKTFVKIWYKTIELMYNSSTQWLLLQRCSVLSLLKTQRLFLYLLFFFPLVCVCVTWAIKSYRSFIVLSIVRSFDGQFKASITFGNEFFTACFVLGCLGLLREYAIAVRFHK